MLMPGSGRSAGCHIEGGLTRDGAIDDDRLRLVFTCCHPALAMEGAGIIATTSLRTTQLRPSHSSTASSATPLPCAISPSRDRHRSHDERDSMIRRYITWRNRQRDDDRLRVVSLRANVG